jgi:hypothetical protein
VRVRMARAKSAARIICLYPLDAVGEEGVD